MFLSKYRQLSADNEVVSGAANCLEVTEFRLFELAYQDWFGCIARETELERVYIIYWFTGDAPCWVRHFCRKLRQLGRGIGHDAAPATNGMLGLHSVTLGCLAISLVLLLGVVW